MSQNRLFQTVDVTNRRSTLTPAPEVLCSIIHSDPSQTTTQGYRVYAVSGSKRLQSQNTTASFNRQAKPQTRAEPGICDKATRRDHAQIRIRQSAPRSIVSYMMKETSVIALFLALLACSEAGLSLSLFLAGCSSFCALVTDCKGQRACSWSSAAPKCCNSTSMWSFSDGRGESNGWRSGNVAGTSPVHLQRTGHRQRHRPSCRKCSCFRQRRSGRERHCSGCVWR